MHQKYASWPCMYYYFGPCYPPRVRINCGCLSCSGIFPASPGDALSIRGCPTHRVLEMYGHVDTCICVYLYSVYFIYIYRSALRTLSSVLTLIEYGKQCCVVPHTLLTCHLNRIRKIPTLRWGGSRGFRPTRLVTWVTAYGGYVLCNNQIHRQCR